MVRMPKYRKNEHTAHFGLWTLELLTIQRFSFIVDQIPPHRSHSLKEDIILMLFSFQDDKFPSDPNSGPHCQVFIFQLFFRWCFLTFFFYRALKASFKTQNQMLISLQSHESLFRIKLIFNYKELPCRVLALCTYMTLEVGLSLMGWPREHCSHLC